jgi:DNA uptake protein ComE-like DNA-binding protein
MSWRDFFYFSKGERRALVLMLSLVVIGWIILMLTKSLSPEPEKTAPPATSQTSAPDTSVQASPLQPKTPPGRQQTSSRTAAKPTETVERVKKPTETVAERVKRLTALNHPRRTEKLAAGSTLEINSADTTDLKKIPGIGSAFAGRIVKYRNLLGGYYSVTQLKEVYGIDEEKYGELAPWFTVDTSFIRRLSVNTLPQDSLRKHPYIDYRQAKVMERLRKQKKGLSGWENLQLLDEFSENDKLRMLPYLSFE